MATQNPIETEGTYPLPEAQVDRFMMKVVVGYPSPTEEFVVVDRALQPDPVPEAIITPGQLVHLQRQVDAVYVDPALVEYAVRLATATRDPAEVGLPHLVKYVTYGASPRASINVTLAARALAFVRGRDYVLPQEITELAPDVLRHRLVLSYEALADDVTPDAVIGAVLAAVRAPVASVRER
jgi:MoxR-like ATPase